MSLSIVLVLVGLIAALGVFGYRCYQRVQHLRLGRPAGPFGQWGQRTADVLLFVCGQARLFRFKGTGLAHVFIFWGFVLLLPTILQAMLEGLFPGFVLPFFATFGPLLLLQDFIALAVIAGVLYGLYYRMLVRPERYQGSHQFEGNLVLGFILTIMVTLLCHTGIRQNLGEAHVAATWQPVSALVGSLFRELAHERQNLVAVACWWAHLGVVLVFLTLLPLGKHFHVVTSVFNVLLRNLSQPGRLAPAARGEGAEGAGGRAANSAAQRWPRRVRGLRDSAQPAARTRGGGLGDAAAFGARADPGHETQRRARRNRGLDRGAGDRPTLQTGHGAGLGRPDGVHQPGRNAGA